MPEALSVVLIAVLIVSVLMAVALVIARLFFGVSLGRKAPRQPGQTVDPDAPIQFRDDRSE